MSVEEVVVEREQDHVGRELAELLGILIQRGLHVRSFRGGRLLATSAAVCVEATKAR